MSDRIILDPPGPDPTYMGLWSVFCCVIPGFGHFILGQHLKSVLIFLVSYMAILAEAKESGGETHFALILWAIWAVDCAQLTSRLKSQGSIGRWDWF